MPGMYPPAPPTISGNTISVDLFLKTPSRVQKVMTDLAKERFIADNVFASGPAAGGAVIYDRVTQQYLYTDRDPEVIAPGAEFPLVGSTLPEPLVAKVAKRGGAVQVTYEAVRRNDIPVVQNALTRLRNSLVAMHDKIAVDTLLADTAVLTGTAGAEWNHATGTDPFADLAAAVSEIEQQDLGYVADTVLINPQERLSLLTNKDLRDTLPREQVNTNPVLSGQLAGLCGLRNWIVSAKVPAGTVIVCNAKVVGSIRDEMPLYTRTIDQPENESWLIQAARVSVPIITDPKAALVLTGVYDATP